MANIWLLAIFLIPTLLLYFLRVNAVLVYLGLCLGYVISQFDGTNREITKIANNKVVEQLGGTNDVRLILLLLPPVLILLFTMKTASSGKGKFSLNLLPSIAVGLLAVLTVVPLLPVRTAVNILNSSLWLDFAKYEGAIVAISGLVILILVIMQNSKLVPAKSSKHHKSKE